MQNKIITNTALLLLMLGLFSVLVNIYTKTKNFNSFDSNNQISPDQYLNIIYDNKPLTPESRNKKSIVYRELYSIANSTSSNIIDKAYATEIIIDSFFNYGTEFAYDIFQQREINERQIFDFGIKIYKERPTERLSLLLAYIALTFDYPESSEENILSFLQNAQKYATDNKISSNNNNKLGSILYLSKKRDYKKVEQNYGDYNIKFEQAFNATKKKTLIAFMWLAALSDINKDVTEKEKELLDIIISEQDFSLRENLKTSYFRENKEPDTVNLIQIISNKHPSFKEYIKNFKN